MSFIQRITVVDDDGSGHRVYRKKKKKKKKVSRLFRPAERNSRKLARATETWGSVYGKRLRRSRRKKKNGFLRHGPKNVFKANRKAFKKLRKMRIT